MKLILVSGDKRSKLYRTVDGKYEVLGEDLGTRPPAGPVWQWRPAHGTPEWTDDMSRAFGRKGDCLADLQAHLAKGATP